MAGAGAACRGAGRPGLNRWFAGCNRCPTERRRAETHGSDGSQIELLDLPVSPGFSLRVRYTRLSVFQEEPLRRTTLAGRRT